MQLKFLTDESAVEARPASERVDPIYRSKVALAAQYFVAADILQRGWNCSIASEGLRYDLIADIAGLRRVQVKMSMFPRPASPHARALHYIFGGGLNAGLAMYVGDVDLFALVAMDARKIIYAFPHQFPDSHKSMFKPSDFSDERSDLSWREVLRAWEG